MTEAEAQAPNPTPPPAEPAKRSKRPVIIVAVLMLLEGAAIFAVAKYFFMSEPSDVQAVEVDPLARPGGESAAPQQLTAEVEIAECRPSNFVSGRLVNFKLRVSALVLLTDEAKAAELLEANQSRITDRINFIIRSAEPHHLAEPGLETIKRRMKHEIDAIVGDQHLIREVLIPEMLQSGPGL